MIQKFDFFGTGALLRGKDEGSAVSSVHFAVGITHADNFNALKESFDRGYIDAPHIGQRVSRRNKYPAVSIFEFGPKRSGDTGSTVVCTSSPKSKDYFFTSASNGIFYKSSYTVCRRS